LINKLLIFIFSVFIISISTTRSFGQEVEKDSVTTAFRKGRWLSGFSGSISSGSTKNISTDVKLISNRYRIEASSGAFIRDRINLGFNIDLERENAEGQGQVRTSEDIFIAPKGTYYFSKSEVGSLFVSFSPGIILYRDKTGYALDNDFNEFINKGTGFGTKTTIGYSYVIFDLVAFDLGLNWSSFKINITQSASVNSLNSNTNFIITDLSFSFGFKIFLGV